MMLHYFYDACYYDNHRRHNNLLQTVFLSVFLCNLQQQLVISCKCCHLVIYTRLEWGARKQHLFTWLAKCQAYSDVPTEDVTAMLCLLGNYVTHWDCTFGRTPFPPSAKLALSTAAILANKNTICNYNFMAATWVLSDIVLSHNGFYSGDLCDLEWLAVKVVGLGSLSEAWLWYIHASKENTVSYIKSLYFPAKFPNQH